MDSTISPSSYSSHHFHHEIKNANDLKAGHGNPCCDVPNQTDSCAVNSTEETSNGENTLNLGTSITKSPESWMVTRGSSDHWIAQQRPQGFFQDKELGKCIWGSNINYKWDHTRAYGFKALNEYSASTGRIFLVPTFTSSKWKGKSDTEWIHINRQKTKRNLVVHPAELGWNVPKEHDRHLLSLPIEILRNILKYTVIFENSHGEQAAVRPKAVTTNWKREWSAAHYELRSDFQYRNENDSLLECNFVMLCKRYDKKNREYIEKGQLSRAPIDATVMRVNKMFYEICQDFLYGENNFSFDMTTLYYKQCHPTMMRNNGVYIEHQPLGHQPGPHDHDRNLRMGNAFTAIRHHPRYHAAKHARYHRHGDCLQHGECLMSLDGWVYYDHFLRWLWLVGPENAKKVKNLTFAGTVKVHDCEWSFCTPDSCNPSIVEGLQLYLPFIKEFFTSLETLTLVVKSDRLGGLEVMENDLPPSTRREALEPLLREIQQSDILWKLKVIDQNNKNEDLDFVDLFATAIEERYSQRFKEEIRRRENDEMERRAVQARTSREILMRGVNKPAFEPVGMRHMRHLSSSMASMSLHKRE